MASRLVAAASCLALVCQASWNPSQPSRGNYWGPPAGADPASYRQHPPPSQQQQQQQPPPPPAEDDKDESAHDQQYTDATQQQYQQQPPWHHQQQQPPQQQQQDQQQDQQQQQRQQGVPPQGYWPPPPQAAWGGQPQSSQWGSPYGAPPPRNDTEAYGYPYGQRRPQQQQQQQYRMSAEQRQWQQEQEEKRQKEEERRRKEEEKAAALREMQMRFRSVGDDVLLKKFLKARKYDVEAASQMLGASLRWRRAYGCPIDPVPIAHQLALGAVFESGLDYDGHPVIYHFSSGLGPNPSADQVALAARAAVYWMEKATKKSKDGKVTVVVVRDIALRNAQQGGGGGGGFANLRYPRHLAKILEANFPESLKRAVVYPADAWFSTLWKVASRFVDAETRAKIALVTDRSELLKYVPYNQLLRTLGGANPYRFSLDHVAPGLQQRLYSNYFPHQPRALPPPPPPPQRYQQQQQTPPPPPSGYQWQQQQQPQHQQQQPQYPPYGSSSSSRGGPPPPPPPPPPKVPGY